MITNPKSRRCAFLVRQWVKAHNAQRNRINPHGSIAILSMDACKDNLGGVKLAVYSPHGQFLESIHCPTHKALYGVLKTWERYL